MHHYTVCTFVVLETASILFFEVFELVQLRRGTVEKVESIY